MRPRFVAALLGALLALAPPPALGQAISFADRNNITSPKAFQVFPRSGTTGAIVVSGSVLDGGTAHDIEANFNGGSFSTIATGATTTFSGSLASQPQGAGTVRVRWKDKPQTFIDVPTVGIGDLFLIVGQSNAVGQATHNQFYASSGTLDGLTPFASVFGGDYTWRLLNDSVGSLGCANWTDAVNNNCGGAMGSIWPLVATKMLASTGVPIGFVNAGLDSSTISQWLPGSSHTDRTTAYGAAVFRSLQIAAVWKGVLWWQGEGDAQIGTAGATYTSNMETIADAFFTDLGGAVLVPVRIQQGANWTTANQNIINTAITNAHNADSAHIASPADFSNLYADDGAHIQNDANVRAAADGSVNPSATVPMWTAIKTAFGYP